MVELLKAVTLQLRPTESETLGRDPGVGILQRCPRAANVRAQVRSTGPSVHDLTKGKDEHYKIMLCVQKMHRVTGRLITAYPQKVLVLQKPCCSRVIQVLVPSRETWDRGTKHSFPEILKGKEIKEEVLLNCLLSLQ